MKALLIDTVRCTGCRGCMVACKQQNNLKAEKTSFFVKGHGYQNPKDVSPDTWCLVTYNEVMVKGRFEWVFGKRQCMHCIEPGCASACPVGALKKTPDGPVDYHPGICIGCRYCMLACPFLIPRFEYDTPNPYIRKCTMCADRLAEGGITACAKACPTGAITFGEREDLIRDAKRRIANNPTNYLHKIYGLEEAGGTCVLHISNVPFETLGYITDIKEAPLYSTAAPAMKAIPSVMFGAALILGVGYHLRNRTRGEESPGERIGGDHE